MTNLSMSLVNILYNYQLLRLAGENGVAAYGVIMYAAFLFVAVFVGYAVGSAPIVSFHYGARNHAEVHNLYRKSLRLIAVVAVYHRLHVHHPLCGAHFRGLRCGIAGPDQPGLPAVCAELPHHGLQRVRVLLLHGAGRRRDQRTHLLFAHAAVPGGAVLLLPLLLGIDGIWLAVTAAELAALLVSSGMFITKDQEFHYRKAE